jgi:hypothetical protein
MDEYNYMSLGNDCYPAMALRDLCIRKEALPFDWVLSSADSITECIKDDFKYFHKELKLVNNNSRLCDKYGFLFMHDYPTLNEKRNYLDSDSIFYSENTIVDNWKDYYDNIIEKYQRRIVRLNEYLSSEKPLFILYSGDPNEIQKFKKLFEIKYKKTNIIYIVYSSCNLLVKDDTIISCVPGSDNLSSEWLNAINIGKQKIACLN